MFKCLLATEPPKTVKIKEMCPELHLPTSCRFESLKDRGNVA